MKKSFFILLMMDIFLLNSCTNTYYKTDKKLSKLYKKETSKYELPFILNFPNYKDKPVTRIKFGNKYFYMLVDTGAPINILFEKGCNKINLPTKTELECYVYENIKFYLDKEGKNLTDSVTVSQLDGILGLDYLKRFETVTFDYKNSQIKFNDKLLTLGTSFVYKRNHVCCDFIINNIKFSGLIDTGLNGFIFNDQVLINLNLDKNLSNFTFDGIKIAQQNYTNTKGIYYKNPNIKTNPKNPLHWINFLGFSFFKDHVLRINFRNMKFEIE